MPGEPSAGTSTATRTAVEVRARGPARARPARGDSTKRPRLGRSLHVTMNYNLPHSHNQHFHSDGLFLAKFLVINIALVDITPEERGTDGRDPGSHEEFHKFWRSALGTACLGRPSRCADDEGRRPHPLLDDVAPRDEEQEQGVRWPMLSLSFGEASAPHS